ncbi:hypothetical protein PR048_021453 [Dryococelus australis]|uniref:Uncharacterized protein n=1 Tax=Dryococelus australis TaxID=614101 RepID=A0ABQ9GY96_9NEOP|nr:hypothetical protein PR048_021453 [Dryococelus australis]
MGYNNTFAIAIVFECTAVFYSVPLLAGAAFGNKERRRKVLIPSAAKRGEIVTKARGCPSKDKMEYMAMERIDTYKQKSDEHIFHADSLSRKVSLATPASSGSKHWLANRVKVLIVRCCMCCSWLLLQIYICPARASLVSSLRPFVLCQSVGGKSNVLCIALNVLQLVEKSFYCTAVAALNRISLIGEPAVEGDGSLVYSTRATTTNFIYNIIHSEVRMCNRQIGKHYETNISVQRHELKHLVQAEMRILTNCGYHIKRKPAITQTVSMPLAICDERSYCECGNLTPLCACTICYEKGHSCEYLEYVSDGKEDFGNTCSVTLPFIETQPLSPAITETFMLPPVINITSDQDEEPIKVIAIPPSPREAEEIGHMIYLHRTNVSARATWQSLIQGILDNIKPCQPSILWIQNLSENNIYVTLRRQMIKQVMDCCLLPFEKIPIQLRIPKVRVPWEHNHILKYQHVKAGFSDSPPTSPEWSPSLAQAGPSRRTSPYTTHSSSTTPAMQNTNTGEPSSKNRKGNSLSDSSSTETTYTSSSQPAQATPPTPSQEFYNSLKFHCTDLQMLCVHFNKSNSSQGFLAYLLRHNLHDLLQFGSQMELWGTFPQFFVSAPPRELEDDEIDHAVICVPYVEEKKTINCIPITALDCTSVRTGRVPCVAMTGTCSESSQIFVFQLRVAMEECAVCNESNLVIT